MSTYIKKFKEIRLFLSAIKLLFTPTGRKKDSRNGSSLNAFENTDQKPNSSIRLEQWYSTKYTGDLGLSSSLDQLQLKESQTSKATLGVAI